MTAEIIDGKRIAGTLKARTTAEAAEFAARIGRPPGLAVLLVGDDPASEVYVRNKSRETVACGLRSFEHRLPVTATESEVVALVKALNADPNVDGILVQLPLPRHVAETRVIEAIDPAKDVDGFHPMNAGRLASGADGLVPCTPQGCVILAKSALPSLEGLEAVVIGRSNIVGKPVAQLLLRENATVTVAHSRTRDLPAVVRRADVVVAAAGRPQMVRGDWIKPGAVVIDVGINRIATADGKSRLVGDVAFDEVRLRARALTPVPGGVGPMTIACLLQNTLLAAKARHGLASPAQELRP
jgi:methylenetetrahydrofolate dehydrogenase (NADP+)/methenyltetrahydrofolate cyclohydrolase